MYHFSFKLCHHSIAAYDRARPEIASPSWKGMFVFGSEPDQVVLITHGAPNGSVTWDGDVPDGCVVVCCHPAAVQRAHPKWHVVGSWEESTVGSLQGDSFLFGPKAGA